MEPIGDRQAVAHLEGADEQVELAAVVHVVVEPTAARVHRVERLVGRIAERGDELRRLPWLATLRDEVDVLARAPAPVVVIPTRTAGSPRPQEADRQRAR